MKRKTLTTALLAGLTGTVGIANIATAVNVNPDGLGQVLIYPYYTVRNGTDTLFTVVNTTNEVKAVKVRFLEGENSREVLDFNLYLSPFDVWVAAVTDNGTGGSISTPDVSCTVPPIPADGFGFLGYGFAGDTGSTTLDRTREGYAEVIEMGVVSEASLAAFANHNSGSFSCAAINSFWAPGGVWDVNPNAGMSPPSGGLFGGISLIQVEAGLDVSYNADALEDFSDAILHTEPGSIFPNLNNANPPRSVVFDNGTVVESFWATGAEAVSAVYMHDQIMNTYVLDSATLSGTDWVVTFPTKRFYVDTSFAIGTPPVPPFTSVFQGGADGDGLACEAVDLDIFDREENSPVAPIGFSPPSPIGGNDLCYEVNIVTFNNSNVLGSVLSLNISTEFEHGWAVIGLGGTGHSTTSLDGDTYVGLPATGFAVQTFNNGTLTDEEGTAVVSNYAGLFEHRATRQISGGS